MFSFSTLLAGALALQAVSIVATPTTKDAKVTITLDGGTFTGNNNLLQGTHEFKGIPFAQPPVGDLRFRLPRSIEPYAGKFDATKYGLACPQQAFTVPAVPNFASQAADFLVNTVYGQVFADSEDCLTVNVIKPAKAKPGDNLPVVVWIFGGGFEVGSPSIYDGGRIVARSVYLNSPVIYVSMNYRLSGFGFLPGKEAKAAGIGNLGLQDQRECFRWVQKYISQFGGDPKKVTIFGESAGAISVSLHMLAYGGSTGGLFRAGFMMSGAPIPVGDMSNGQKYFDALIKDTGCYGRAVSDPLGCLRSVPYEKLKAAINLSPSFFSYQALNLAWLPRADGSFLAENPQRQVEKGLVANIPYITGNCDDEGTLFSLSSLNVTTTPALKNYLNTVLFPGAPDAAVDGILALYPADLSAGSPFGTGALNAVTSQYKRIAALQGDAVFQAPRRWMLQNTISKNPYTWVYLNKRLKSIPILGSAHSSDILNMFGGGEMADYLIRFATYLDPNSNSPSLTVNWPKYDLITRKSITFQDVLPAVLLSQDNYRQDAMSYFTNFTLANPI